MKTAFSLSGRLHLALGGRDVVVLARHALERHLRLPVGEELLQHGGDLGLVEVAHDGDLGGVGAVEPVVELLRAFELHRARLFQRLLERGLVAPVVLGVDVEDLLHLVAGPRVGLGELRLDAGDGLGAQLLELGGVEARLPQHVHGELQRRGEVGPRGLEARPRPRDAPRDLEALELVGELAARVLGRAAREHAPGERRVLALAAQRLLVAEVQVDRDVHRLAAVLLGEQRHLHRAELQPLGARVDVGLRRVERLGLRARPPAP